MEQVAVSSITLLSKQIRKHCQHTSITPGTTTTPATAGDACSLRSGTFNAAGEPGVKRRVWSRSEHERRERRRGSSETLQRVCASLAENSWERSTCVRLCARGNGFRQRQNVFVSKFVIFYFFPPRAFLDPRRLPTLCAHNAARLAPRPVAAEP